MFPMPLVILQGLAWHEIGRSKGPRQREEEEKARKKCASEKRYRMSTSEGTVCRRAETMARA